MKIKILLACLLSPLVLAAADELPVLTRKTLDAAMRSACDKEKSRPQQATDVQKLRGRKVELEGKVASVDTNGTVTLDQFVESWTATTFRYYVSVPLAFDRVRGLRIGTNVVITGVIDLIETAGRVGSGDDDQVVVVKITLDGKTAALKLVR